MKSSSRLFAIASIAVGPVLLVAGCGSSDSGSKSTLASIQPSSYVTIQPATTTTTLGVSTTLGDGTSAAEQIHVVVAGDSVYGIATKYGIEPEVLASYNSWEDGIGHAILPGDEVKIPPGAKVPGAAAPGGDTSGGDGATGTTEPGLDEGDPATGCTHVIVAGENPSKVADNYGITLDELRAANASNPAMTSFVVGQTLNIPPGGDCG